MPLPPARPGAPRLRRRRFPQGAAEEHDGRSGEEEWRWLWRIVGFMRRRAGRRAASPREEGLWLLSPFELAKPLSRCDSYGNEPRFGTSPELTRRRAAASCPSGPGPPPALRCRSRHRRAGARSASSWLSPPSTPRRLTLPAGVTGTARLIRSMSAGRARERRWECRSAAPPRGRHASSPGRRACRRSGIAASSGP